MRCRVSTAAHNRGFGTAQEMVSTAGDPPNSLSPLRKGALLVERIGKENAAWLEDLLR